jgi:acetyltransferase-like isoleucine patch superfamily enzyme
MNVLFLTHYDGLYGASRSLLNLLDGLRGYDIHPHVILPKNGDLVLISYFVAIFDTNTHPLDWNERRREVTGGYPNSAKRAVQPVTEPVGVEDDVWVGKHAAIMKGCEIGSRSIVGTRSVVTKSFPEDSLICGNPAVLVRTITRS